MTAHAYGTPEVFTDDENLETLATLVARFEDVLPEPFRLDVSPANDAYASSIVRDTVGFRLPVARIEAKEKMSQDKSPDVIERIIAELDGRGPYANPTLAAYMRRTAGRTGVANEGSFTMS